MLKNQFTKERERIGSMGSWDGVKERGTVLMRGFYKAGTKMTPRFRHGIGVSGSRNGTFDHDFCDYGHERSTRRPRRVSRRPRVCGDT